jgi:trans-2,3-dihydro-3-hydroxyanthranilate isomerase
MIELRYVFVDVFAEAALRGNPLAVVFDADGLSSAQMQSLGREFNLSETAFILKPRDPAHTAHVRIFTPSNEVPFAGHPNIGSAFALSQRRTLPSDDLLFDEKAGLVRLKLQRDSGTIVGASLQAPRTLSTEPGPTLAATAAALSLAAGDIVTTTHPPITASVGLEFLFAEVTDIAALGRARAHIPAFDLIRASHRVEGVHIYAKSTTPTGARIQARNLSPYDGIGEDSATGSATASLVALLAQCDPRADCDFILEAHQGLEMGRPSLLHGFAEKRGDKVAPPHIRGLCLQFMQGALTL